MERLPEFHRLEVHVGALFAFGRETFLGDKLLYVNGFRLPVLELAAKGEHHLRVQVRGNVHQAGTPALCNEEHRRIIALHKAEALDIERFGGIVPVQDGINAGRVEFLYAHYVSLVLVHQVVRGGVVGAVGKDGQHAVFSGEFAQEFPAAFLVEALDVRIPPDVLALQGGNALGLELDFGNGVFGDQVAPGAASLDGEGTEIPLHAGFLETLLGTELDAHGFRFSVVVHGEPEDAGAIGPGRNVIVLVTRDGGNGKTFGVMGRALAVAVDDVINGALVAAVEHAGVQQVFPEEGFVRHLGNTEFAVFCNDDNLAQV